LAIILKAARPNIQVRDDKFVIPAGWEELERHRGKLRDCIQAVGVLRVHGDPYLEWVGTAFLVGPGLVMVGGHAAETFLTPANRAEPRFVDGKTASVSFFTSVVDAQGVEVKITSAVFLHPCYDVALLRIEPPNEIAHPTVNNKSQVPPLEKIVNKSAGGNLEEEIDPTAPPRLPVPLILGAAPPEQIEGRKVVVIGFPARDTRNDQVLIEKVFGNMFGVKSLQPGLLRGIAPLDSPRYQSPDFHGGQLGAIYVTHDCSTLGGSSGSPVIDLETGHVLGIHYAGLFLQENRAVPGWELARDPHVRQSGVLFSDDPPWLRLWENRAWRSKPVEPEPLIPPPPAPPPKRSQILSTEKLHEIHELLILAGFADQDKLKTLFVTMNLQFVASLPRDGSSADQLLLILDVLNRTPKLPDNELPFVTFLMNAVYNAKPRQESEKLQRYLVEVSASTK
jgi:hypothetical protein